MAVGSVAVGRLKAVGEAEEVKIEEVFDQPGNTRTRSEV